ncbi:MAG: glycosyltransferase family 4 protein [Chitinispirillaceae bacterium]|jgi:glycosyltransferase involved in cell wall biosynthesis|nr:glycosyltransferase family 4 protein [Chitinispirillaceae bacterium]
MRIWFAAAQRSNNFGGVYRSVSSLAAQLSRRGHKVTIIWSDHEGKKEQFYFAVRLFIRLLFSLFHRPHWIIARSSDGLLCAIARRLGITAGTRVALHSHGWEEKVYEVERRIPRTLISHPTTWKARLLRFPLLRRTLRDSDLCICGTIEEARFIGNRYPQHAPKIVVVGNGVDHTPAPFWPGQSELPHSFLLVAGFTWKKNVEYALALFSCVLAAIPDARLFCVGTGTVPRSARKAIDSLGDAVFIVEREQPRKMSRWYETCPFLLSASRYEGGRSLAILEAQNLGMVVFATAIPSSREFIRDSKTGILISGCDELRDSERIIETVTDSGRCRSIGTAAWKSAGRMSWERQGGRLEKLLLRR